MAECHICIPNPDVSSLLSGSAKLFSGSISGQVSSTTQALGSITIPFTPSALLIDPLPAGGGYGDKALTIASFNPTGQYQVWKSMSGSGTRPTVLMKFQGTPSAIFTTDTINYQFSFSYVFLAFR